MEAGENPALCLSNRDIYKWIGVVEGASHWEEILWEGIQEV